MTAIVYLEGDVTCFLVARALMQSGLDMPVRVATALADGILTDTLDLYRVRRRDVVEFYLGSKPAAARLHPGAPVGEA